MEKDYISTLSVNQLAYIGSEELQIVELSPL
jgi:hypothetical protein